MDSVYNGEYRQPVINKNKYSLMAAPSVINNQISVTSVNEIKRGARDTPYLASQNSFIGGFG